MDKYQIAIDLLNTLVSRSVLDQQTIHDHVTAMIDAGMHQPFGITTESLESIRDAMAELLEAAEHHPELF